MTIPVTHAGDLGFLDALSPIRLIDAQGHVVRNGSYDMPDSHVLLDLYRLLVVGRRFNRQATALTRQGRLAVYPSSYGQEACQVAPVLALRESDWLFPTYRESVALVARGVDPVETLTLLRGDWHCGYDPYAHRVAPQCTPLATSAPHAVGLAHAAQLRAEDTAVLVFMGDGATSEGDAHEAFNFAAVWDAPVVFLIQNNQFAISVPLAKQSRAPTLAHKAVGYGMRGYYVDGNDAAAVYAVVLKALSDARAGNGPSIVEGLTYRLDAHTNADDASRYRSSDEVETWRRRDPIERIEQLLVGNQLLDEIQRTHIIDEAENYAAALRKQMNADPLLDPKELFAHVYTEPTQQLREQARQLQAEMATVDEEV